MILPRKKDMNLKILKHKKTIINIFKVLVSLIIIFVILNNIDFIILKNNLSEINLPLFTIALLLLSLNLVSQFAKWDLVLKLSNYQSNFKELAGSTLYAISLGIITPGKIGEMGKVFFTKAENKKTVIQFQLLEKIYDTMIVIFGGILTLPFLPNLFINKNLQNRIVQYIFIFFIFVFFTKIIINPNLIFLLFHNIFNFFSKKKQLIKEITLDNKKSIHLFLLSKALYLIYITQFIILIIAITDIKFIEALIIATSVMLIKTLLPFSFADLGIREGSTIFIFKLYNLPAEKAIISAFSLFLINFIIPSLLGCLLYLKKLKKSL